MALPTKRLTTPKGEITWVFINGNPKKDLNGNDRYTAQVEFKKGSPEAKWVTEQIETFWNENKPKGRKCKSNGIHPVMEKDPDTGEWTVETDRIAVQMWTGTTFKDDSPKTIDVRNAKNRKVNLGTKRIGNGTIGRLDGVMAIYDNGPAASGVTIYLNAIQIIKFVEFSQEPEFDEEDGWTGEDEDGGFPEEETKASGSPDEVDL